MHTSSMRTAMARRRRQEASMSSVRLVAIAAAALLAGCVSLAPKYERPRAPVPDQFAGDSVAMAGPVASQLDWQRFFGDERLKRLIAIALANNRDLRIAALSI